MKIFVLEFINWKENVMINIASYILTFTNSIIKATHLKNSDILSNENFIQITRHYLTVNSTDKKFMSVSGTNPQSV